MHSKDVNSNFKTQYRSSNSWIDDLPPCQKTGIAFSVNKVFREDGSQIEEHAFEDRSFHCQPDDGTYLYGIFDGHNGPRAADFSLQRMAAEILLGQLIEKRNDEEIKDVLRQAFISVEKGYLDSIDELLAERASVQCEIPDALNAYDAYQKYPHLFDKLKEINYQLSSCTSAVICLIHNNRLYVANIGTTLCLLTRMSHSCLTLTQLSTTHDLQNEDEILRLQQLQVPLEMLSNSPTRCLGGHLVLEHGVVAEPDLCGSIQLSNSCRFLIMLSTGLWRSAEEVKGEDAGKFIVQSIVEGFRIQTDLNSIAQSVIDKIIQLHQEKILKNLTSNRKIEDMTLLIRNFNFPLQNSNLSGTNSSQNSVLSNSSTISDSFNNSDDGKRLKPYVDFSCYYNNVRKH